MWQWLRALWGGGEYREEKERADRKEVDDRIAKFHSPYREMEASDSPQPSTPQELQKSLLSIIQDAAQEVAEDKAKIEKELFTNEKVRGYFQKAIKYVMVHLDSDSYNFVLVHANDAGLPEKGFSVFAEMFVRACKELGISSEINATYIRVDKPGVRKLIAKLPTQTPRINIDEKVRAMLGS
jgi:hypothetical protein